MQKYTQYLRLYFFTWSWKCYSFVF